MNGDQKTNDNERIRTVQMDGRDDQTCLNMVSSPTLIGPLTSVFFLCYSHSSFLSSFYRTAIHMIVVSFSKTIVHWLIIGNYKGNLGFFHFFSNCILYLL